MTRISWIWRKRQTTKRTGERISLPTCNRFFYFAMIARSEIQRTDSPARTGGLLPGKREGLDPLLRQSWPSPSDSCRFPRREGGSDGHLPCNFESGRSKAKIENHDYPAIFTRYRSNEGAGFFWLLLTRLGGLHRDRPLCRRLPLQSALGNGRSHADPARARLAGA